MINIFLKVNEGDRIAQIIFERITRPTFNEFNRLDETERGAACFGSTGGIIEQKSKILKQVIPLNTTKDNMCSRCKVEKKLENCPDNLCHLCTSVKTWFTNHGLIYNIHKEYMYAGEEIWEQEDGKKTFKQIWPPQKEEKPLNKEEMEENDVNLKKILNLFCMNTN
jgi:Na+-translocating ferredoxin:NAD+ oxidoreductase RnfG subunit